MSHIPQVSLGELLTLERRPVEVLPDVQYAEIGIYCFGRGIFHKTPRTGLEVGDKQLFLIQEGDFILQVTFAWEGAVGLASKAEHGMYGSTRFPTFRVNESLCFPPYLLNYFRTPLGLEQLIKISPGSAGRNRVLSLKRIPEVLVPLPLLEEQRRIVAGIEELVGKIEKVRSLRQKALEETEALLTSALNLTFEKHINKHGWQLKPLRQAAEVARGKFAHRPRNEPRFYGGNIPFIQIGDISNSNHYIREYSQTLNQDGLRISRMFPKGSIVIAITGATIGVTGILTFDSCFPDSIVGIIPNQEKVIPEFIYWSLEYVKKVALAEATQTTQPNINLQILDKLKIPVPPLPEQQRIVAYLDELQTKVDKMQRLREQAIRELDVLLPSIFDKAFKGEL